MSTAGGVCLSTLVLAIVGLLPTLYLVGKRWIVAPLAVLSGAVISAVSATCFVAVGGPFMGWFFLWSAVIAASSATALIIRSPRSGDRGSQGLRLTNAKESKSEIHHGASRER